MKCPYCKYSSSSQTSFDIHVSNYHESELANEGKLQRLQTEIQPRQVPREPQTGFTLESLYGNDYFICRQCLRPCVASPTLSHPDHDTCHNLYWLRSDWLRNVKQLIIDISLSKGYQPPNLTAMSREKLARILKYKISAPVPEVV